MKQTQGYRWQRREKRATAKKNRMPKHGRGVFTIQALIVKRAKKEEQRKRVSDQKPLD